jgi:hypothetical protein
MGTVGERETPSGRGEAEQAHKRGDVADGAKASLRVLDQAVSDGVLPGAVLFASERGQTLVHAATGAKVPAVARAADAQAEPIGTDTVFDLG